MHVTLFGLPRLEEEVGAESCVEVKASLVGNSHILFAALMAAGWM